MERIPTVSNTFLLSYVFFFNPTYYWTTELTIQLLYASGFLFMGATEEQMQLLEDAGIMHVSYILILFSIAFILFLCESFF